MQAQLVDRQQIRQLHTGTHVACTLSFVLGSCELSRNGRYSYGIPNPGNVTRVY